MDLNPICDQASIGILVIDQKGEIERVNQFVEKLFGYTKDELVGQNIEILIPQAVRSRHAGHMKSYFGSPLARPMGLGLDLFATRKDGVEIPVEISLSFFEEGERRTVAAFVNDISIRKKAETDLRESEEKLQQMNSRLEQRVSERTAELADALLELQETNSILETQIALTAKAEEEARNALSKEQELSELKSRFVSMASHEFRTPLTSILSSASLISKYIEAGNADRSEKHLGRIKSSVRNLTGILNDFLSLEKLRSGKIQVLAEPCFLQGICEEVVEEMQAILKEGQKIEFTPQGPDAESWVDPHAFRNVITNLLSNASKYSREGDLIEFQTWREGGEFGVKITDHGIGIPANEQSRLFDRFFRAKNAQNIAGTGLGLHLVSHYLNLMGGEISFSSVENEGTTFSLKIPINKPS
ncbi:MAG: PAS domain S-box protein [Bacteroidia bacterium]|nr:PAS domain S-box protein [Bacteroidia bacterium]